MIRGTKMNKNNKERASECVRVMQRHGYIRLCTTTSIFLGKRLSKRKKSRVTIYYFFVHHDSLFLFLSLNSKNLNGTIILFSVLEFSSFRWIIYGRFLDFTFSIDRVLCVKLDVGSGGRPSSRPFPKRDGYIKVCFYLCVFPLSLVQHGSI